MRLIAMTLGVALALAGSSGQFGQGPRVSPIGAPPRIDAVTPSQGPIAGGTDVVFTGAGFTGATVRIDSQVVTPLAQSDSSIRLRMPAHDNGYVTISARSDSGVAYGEFLYVPPRLEDLPPGYITTVAGIGVFVRDYGPALKATVLPAGLALDPGGTLYVAEPGYGKISRIRPDGTIERVTALPVASGGPPGDGGPAFDAQVWFPLSVAVDAAGNVFIPDQNRRIRRIDAATGIITTLAGDGTSEYSGDNGPAVRARVSWPTHIAADAADVFFIDFGALRIRRIHLADGIISTFVGTGTAGYSGDGGPATSAQFDVGEADAGALALDPGGNLYLADTANFRIRRIDRVTGIITTFYRLPPQDAGRDSVGSVRSVTADREGNVYYGGSGRIVKLNSRAEFVTAWGDGSYALPIEGGPAATSGLGHVTGLALDPAGNVFYTDGAVNRVRRIEVATGKLFTVAGIGPSIIGENGPAVASDVSRPYDLAVDRDGNLLIADGTGGGRVRQMDRGGTITTIAGNGSFVGQRTPARATDAMVYPYGIGLDAQGELDVASGAMIMHVDSAGVVRDIVAQSTGAVCGYAGDGGAASAARLCQAWDMSRDANGNLFIADTNNNRIRRVDKATNVITTVVGNGGPVNGYERYNNGKSCGDGGPAINACINTPYGVAIDTAGNLFLSDRSSIRRVDTSGIITTLSASANTTKLVVDAGYLYASVIAGVFRLDASANRTWIAGRSGAGTDAGFSGDGGPARQAKVRLSNQGAGIAIDREGNLYFSDNHRVRAVRFGARIVDACDVAPPAPGGLSNVVAGSTVTLRWNASAGASSYALEAGSTPGASELVNYDTGNSSTGLVAPGVGAGTYYVRMRARNACGTSGVSNETIVRVQ